MWPFQKEFLDAIQEAEVVRIIKLIEAQTSAELRVHIHHKLKFNILDEAALVFRKLGMEKTKDRNGVLIFIVPEKRQFAIIGDEAIDQKVPDLFWENVKDEMRIAFKNDQPVSAITNAIQTIGKELTLHFPIGNEAKNELPDEISYS
jgi:uncharacterized membrane protein